ncbi:hypothetical protein [Enterobacter asburiae]
MSEMPKFSLPQLLSGNPFTDINNFIVTQEDVMPVQQDVLLAHLQYPGLILDVSRE